MKTIWQLQSAKSHFSEVIERASRGEAQIVTKHGKRTAVILSYSDYLELSQKKSSLLELLRTEPYYDIEFERSKDTGRDIDFE